MSTEFSVRLKIDGRLRDGVLRLRQLPQTNDWRRSEARIVLEFELDGDLVKSMDGSVRRGPGTVLLDFMPTYAHLNGILQLLSEVDPNYAEEIQPFPRLLEAARA